MQIVLLSIISYLKKQSFQPGIQGVFSNPFFFIRRSLFLGIRKYAPLLSGKMMDFGCGRKPYQNLFTVTEYIGVDMEQTGHDHKLSLADVFYDGKKIPFGNETFDSVFCSEVLEHVFNPDEILPEIYRTLKPGGRLLLTVPFCWNEHEVPYDYARYSSFGIKHLLQKHGFTILEFQQTGNFARVLFQLPAVYLFELFKEWGKAGYIVSMIFILPFNIAGLLLLPLLPINKSLYFNNIILVQKNNNAVTA